MLLEIVVEDGHGYMKEVDLEPMSLYQDLILVGGTPRPLLQKDGLDVTALTLT